MPPPHVYCIIIYNSQDMEITEMSIIGRVDKDDEYVLTEILFSHKKEQNLSIYHNVDGT